MTDEDTMKYRLSVLERQTSNLSSVVRDAAVLSRRVQELEVDMQEIKSDLKSIRRGLWLAAATFASLAVGVFTLVAQGH